jgi:hypothetical protein
MYACGVPALSDVYCVLLQSHQSLAGQVVFLSGDRGIRVVN